MKKPEKSALYKELYKVLREKIDNDEELKELPEQEKHRIARIKAKAYEKAMRKCIDKAMNEVFFGYNGPVPKGLAEKLITEQAYSKGTHSGS